MEGKLIDRIKAKWPDLDFDTIQVSKHDNADRLRGLGWYLVGEIDDSLEGEGTMLVWSSIPTSETVKPLKKKNPFAKERP